MDRKLQNFEVSFFVIFSVLWHIILIFLDSDFLQKKPYLEVRKRSYTPETREMRFPTLYDDFTYFYGNFFCLKKFHRKNCDFKIFTFPFLRHVKKLILEGSYLKDKKSYAADIWGFCCQMHNMSHLYWQRSCSFSVSQGPLSKLGPHTLSSSLNNAKNFSLKNTCFSYLLIPKPGQNNS